MLRYLDKQKLKKSFFYCLKGYVAFVFLIIFAQRLFMYFPYWPEPNLQKSAPWMNEIIVETDDNLDLKGWYFYPASEDKPVIIFFHGNAQTIEHRVPKVTKFFKKQYGVLLPEYRGYGGNKGFPSEQGLYKDARAFMDWLIDDQYIKTENIVIYGESIGSGVAVQMASEYDVKALVLEVPFDSAVKLAKEKFFFIPFVEYLMWDQYQNDQKIPDIYVPILIATGGQDIVIPPNHGRTLYDLANQPKKYFHYDQATHNDVPFYGFDQEVVNFIEDLQSLEKE